MLTSRRLDRLGSGAGYVSRQVAGWSKRFGRARTPDVGSFETVMTWLHTNQPADVATCLIHNDWRFDNLVLDPAEPTRVLGVLDWEMSTRGDPLMDLGGALAYWVQSDDPIPMQLMRRQPTHLPGMPGRDALVARYLERSGLAERVESFRFYEVFGLFRLAVIVQQIYYRWYHKQTTNPMSESFRMVVNLLELALVLVFKPNNHLPINRLRLYVCLLSVMWSSGGFFAQLINDRASLISAILLCVSTLGWAGGVGYMVATGSSSDGAASTSDLEMESVDEDDDDEGQD